MRCVGPDPDQCCNWYLNDTCVATCPAPMVGDPNTFNCGKKEHFIQKRGGGTDRVLISVLKSLMVSQS